MARTFAWRSAAAAIVAAAAFACKEEVTAPGHCPDLCAADSLVVEDTVLTGIVASDTSVRGYTRIDVGPILLVSNTDSLEAHPLIQFTPIPVRWFPPGIDTAGVTIGKIDSIAFEIRMEQRDTAVHNIRLLVYRVAPTLDSLTSFDSVRTVFSGSAPFDSIPVDDSLGVKLLRRMLPVTAMAIDSADSNVVALALAVRADSQTTVRLSSGDLTGIPPRLRFFVHGAAPRDTFSTELDAIASYDTYVQSPDPPPPPAGVIAVGNQPAARAILRFDIPRYFIDSVTVVRASLQLTTTRPVGGIPGEAVSFAAVPILRDLGGKSILFQDSTVAGFGTATVGQSGVVEIEVGRILTLWKGISPDSLPRAVMVRNTAEDETHVDLEAAGHTAGAAAPQIRLSFVRPFRFGVP